MSKKRVTRFDFDGTADGKDGKDKRAASSAARDDDSSLSDEELAERQKAARKELTVWKRPVKTIYLFLLVATEWLRSTTVKVLTDARGLAAIAAFAIVTFFFKPYVLFAVYWIGLGVASSIGLGT